MARFELYPVITSPPPSAQSLVSGNTGIDKDVHKLDMLLAGEESCGHESVDVVIP